MRLLPLLLPSFLLLRCARALPSYATRLPGGDRVPCAPELPGCTPDGTLIGAWDDTYGFCQGLGHADCRGGVFERGLNAFGGAFIAAGLVWSRELCEADSDGDGYTNGEELGDPCCLWDYNAAIIGGADAPLHPPRSHPGFPFSVPDASVEDVKCLGGDGSSTAPTGAGEMTVAEVHFNPGEVQKVAIISMSNVTVPCDVRTTYMDISTNTPPELKAECSQPGKHCVLVAAETIVDSPRLHHFVLTSCSLAVDSERSGVPLVNEIVRAAMLEAEGVGVGAPSADDGVDQTEEELMQARIVQHAAEEKKKSCNGYLGAWAPGADPFITSRRDSGFRVGGGGSGGDILSTNLEAHYDNYDGACDTTDTSYVKIYYTLNDDNAPTPRPLAEKDLPFTRISANPYIQLPPAEEQVFISNLCQLRVRASNGTSEDDRTAVEVERAFFHGHLAANAMFSRVYRIADDAAAAAADAAASGDVDSLMAKYKLVTPILDLPAWWFDDQFMPDVARDAKARYGEELTSILPSTRAALDAYRAAMPADSPPPPSDRPRLLLRDGDIVHSVCGFNTSDRTKPTPVGVQTIDEMCWSTVTYVTANGARARCAPLQTFLGVAESGGSVDRLWERAAAADAMGLYRHDTLRENYKRADAPEGTDFECIDEDVKALRNAQDENGTIPVGAHDKLAKALHPSCVACMVELVAYADQSGVPANFATCYDPARVPAGALDSATVAQLLAFVRSASA